jgi:hypothetical protein
MEISASLDDDDDYDDDGDEGKNTYFRRQILLWT